MSTMNAVSYQRIAEEILRSFDLSEVLEMNNIEEIEALALLIEAGLIEFPEAVFRAFEEEEN